LLDSAELRLNRFKSNSEVFFYDNKNITARGWNADAVHRIAARKTELRNMKKAPQFSILWACYGHSEGQAGGPGPDCFHGAVTAVGVQVCLCGAALGWAD
jgi:hypothetical protein